VSDRRLRVIGSGRAGGALALALERLGWVVDGLLGRSDDPRGAASGVDLLVIATPDPAVAEVAALVQPDDTTVVAHVAGSLTLEVLAPHPHRASLHPLVALPSAELGADRLAAGAWFAIAGSSVADLGLMADLVAELDGTAIEVPDEQRVPYHAAACIASNHLVALLGQAQRVAHTAGVPLSAYLDLVRATVENVAELGPAAALTGPVARGDEATVARHLGALAPEERPAYEAMAEAARTLLRERDGQEREPT
jgi:predicted short-subunit dehydrogenase-like oxidoreductase (DUF2520 family)